MFTDHWLQITIVYMGEHRCVQPSVLCAKVSLYVGSKMISKYNGLLTSPLLIMHSRMIILMPDVFPCRYTDILEEKHGSKQSDFFSTGYTHAAI
jgi:hypothetical protein